MYLMMKLIQKIFELYKDSKDSKISLQELIAKSL